jgi:hypothetical protein
MVPADGIGHKWLCQCDLRLLRQSSPFWWRPEVLAATLDEKNYRTSLSGRNGDRRGRLHRVAKLRVARRVANASAQNPGYPRSSDHHAWLIRAAPPGQPKTRSGAECNQSTGRTERERGRGAVRFRDHAASMADSRRKPRFFTIWKRQCKIFIDSFSITSWHLRARQKNPVRNDVDGNYRPVTPIDVRPLMFEFSVLPQAVTSRDGLTNACGRQHCGNTEDLSPRTTP